MRFTTALSAFALVVPALAAPTRVPITKRAGPVKANSFIVTFKDAVSKDTFVNSSPRFTQSGSTVVYNYGLMPAAAMTLLGPDLDMVRALKDVQSIEPDSIMSINYEAGLDGFDPVGYKRVSETRESQLAKRNGGSGDGAGVNAYGIDTGIYIQHNCFGGRAFWGATFGEGNKDADGNGHGTHTAGTAVGENFSLAPKANIFAVKVLNDTGSGYTSDIAAGVDWAVTHSKAQGKPAIFTMSLGGLATPNSPLNKAVEAAIKLGIHVTIAAGNSDLPAETSSPANVASANTIGAIDLNHNNEKASFSNYGQLIDVWASGVNVESAWIGSPDATNTISGTSMATPFVCGLLAAMISKYGPMEPAVLSEALKKNAANDVTFSPLDKPTAETTSTDARAQPW